MNMLIFAYGRNSIGRDCVCLNGWKVTIFPLNIGHLRMNEGDYVDRLN